MGIVGGAGRFRALMRERSGRPGSGGRRRSSGCRSATISSLPVQRRLAQEAAGACDAGADLVDARAERAVGRVDQDPARIRQREN